MKITHVIITAAILLCAVVISGCTMSDADIQNYINSHPDEVKAYVDSHGQQISTYLEEHPEILEQITLPETPTPAPLETMVSATETTAAVEPTTVTTQQSTPTTETTTSPTTITTTEPTIVQTTVTTVTPTTTATTTPTTVPTTTPTTQIPDNTPVSTPTLTPTPSPTVAPPSYTADPRTGLPALASIRSSWQGVSTDSRITQITMTCSPENGMLTNLKNNCQLSGYTTEIYNKDFHYFGSGTSGRNVDFSFSVTDGKNGVFSTNEPLADPIYQNRTEIRDLIYNPDGDTVRISGIDYLEFRRV